MKVVLHPAEGLYRQVISAKTKIQPEPFKFALHPPEEVPDLRTVAVRYPFVFRLTFRDTTCNQFASSKYIAGISVPFPFFQLAVRIRNDGSDNSYEDDK